VIKGEEPNIDLLLGFKPKSDYGEKEMTETFQELRNTRKKVCEMRNTMCDQVSSKYSSECAIQ
jgi:hypothetical protein